MAKPKPSPDDFVLKNREYDLAASVNDDSTPGNYFVSVVDRRTSEIITMKLSIFRDLAATILNAAEGVD